MTITAAVLLTITTGCDVPDKYPEPVSEYNIENDAAVNGTKMRLYLQKDDTIKSILSWEHFLKFGNYDVIGVDTGMIKAATIRSGSIVLPEHSVRTAGFLDAQKMGYDGIYLCCKNDSTISDAGLVLSSPDATFDGRFAFDLDEGIPFRLDSAVTTPITATFHLYGVQDSVPNKIFSDELNITFYNAHHTGASVAGLDSVANDDLNMSTTNDSLFTRLLEDLKRYDFNARADTTNIGNNVFSEKLLHKDENGEGYDSTHIKTVADSLLGRHLKMVISEEGDTTYEWAYFWSRDPFYRHSVGDTIHVGAFEKTIVHASSQNAKVFLANRLIQTIDETYSFPSGPSMKEIPPVGPELDDYFCLYTNISGLLDVLDDFKDAYTLYKDDAGDQYQKNLAAYLDNVVGDKNIGALKPSSFSQLILWYTDYLLYAGLCSYIDDDFFSRYINHHKLLVDEVKTLVDKVHNEFNDNNIVIRFYAVAAFYDFILNQGEDNLNKLITYLDEFVDEDGEYGEGIGYCNYVSEIVLPVIYIGLQEQYVYGSNAANPWLPDTSELVAMYRKIGEYLINSSSNWGELPAFDDGPPAMPYLAPYAVINGENRYMGYTRDVFNLQERGIYDSLESAERVSVDGIAPWRMLLYPYNRTFAGSNAWKHPLDSVRSVGSIVQVPTGIPTDQLNLTIIAEENPEDGGTHDQIDHGAIQLVRYTNDGTGNAPHVDHLIIDPGYPGFTDDKRNVREFQYANQNVQMLWDTAFDFSTDETNGESSVPSEEPDENATDEEFLGYLSGKDYHTVEKFDYRLNGGMTGYRYLTPWDIREIIHDYVLNDKNMQNNMWEIVDTDALGMIQNKILDPMGGEGRSSITALYKNGVTLRVDYKYPNKQEIFKFKERFKIPLIVDKRATFYYSRHIDYETAYHGIRGVYTLGNTYYVIDHLPQDSLPSSISLANSWNMPKNTTQMGATGWERFVFEGTTPDSNTFLDPDNPALGKYTSRSRIELAVAGATNVEDIRRVFQMKQGKDDTLATRHLTFENDLSTSPILLTQIRACDVHESLVGLTSNSLDDASVSEGCVWLLEYNDSSKDMLIYNPTQTEQTVEGVTSDAVVWLFHANNAGDWETGRLYNAVSAPSFSSRPASVTVTGGNNGLEVQHDIVF